MTQTKFKTLLEINKFEKYMKKLHDIEPQIMKYNDQGGQSDVETRRNWCSRVVRARHGRYHQDNMVDSIQKQVMCTCKPTANSAAWRRHSQIPATRVNIFKIQCVKFSKN